VIELWQGDRDAIGRAAREHILSRYSWDRTFARLLQEVYPAALTHSRRRLRSAPSWSGRSKAVQLLGETV